MHHGEATSGAIVRQDCHVTSVSNGDRFAFATPKILGCPWEAASGANAHKPARLAKSGGSWMERPDDQHLLDHRRRDKDLRTQDRRKNVDHPDASKPNQGRRVCNG